MNNNSEKPRTYFYYIFQEFVKFSESNHISKKLGTLINETMGIINLFPFINASSVYLVNQETFELDIKYEHFVDSDSAISRNFDELIQNGIIGDTLQNCKLTIFSIDNHKEILLFPILSIEGLIGILIINSKLIVDKIKINAISLIKLILSNLGNIITSYSLKELKNKEEDYIDQVIAFRTKKLVENQAVLGEKIEKMKSNLSMALPHEFRTPINQIHGFSNYLVNYFADKEGEDFGDILEIVGDIKESATRLKLTFENYLYYANLFIITANIKDILEMQKQVTFYSDTVIFEYAMTIAYKYNRNEDLEVYALENQLAIGEEHLIKIIQEITDNCFKFSEPGSKVIISTTIDYNNYNITFYDNGIGLKSDDIDNIDGYIQFERMRNEQQGLGLGLSIVRKILDIYNGEIELKSEPYKYTKVMISIPLSYQEVNNFLMI